MDNTNKINTSNYNRSTASDASVNNKRQYFDKELRALIKQSAETINERYKTSMDIEGIVRPELYCLNRYTDIYHKMDPVEHYCYFETIYNKYRNDIFESLVDDSWLKNGRITIQFGDGMKADREIEEKRKKIKIMLSEIYIIACDLQMLAEKSIEGLDEKFTADLSNKDILRPNIILLHLMRIFYHLNDGKDKKILLGIVDKLEDQLGVKNKTKTLFSEEATSETTSETNSGGLSAIFSLATNLMNKFGLPTPEGIKHPTEKEMQNAIETVFSHETTQKTLQGIMQSMNGSEDFSSAFQKVVSTVTDEKTINDLQETLKNTTDIALLQQKGQEKVDK